MGQSPADVQLPSLDLLRQITDGHVLDQLITTAELTRAEIASRTGISKPTISESVRRLVVAGLLAESGAPGGRRGRAGTFYRLRDDAGVALAMSAGPDGMIIETCDLRGAVLQRTERHVRSPLISATLAPIMEESVRAAVDAAPGPVLAWALSLAGPVDQATGRLVRLPKSPFLLDELNPRQLLGDLVDAPLRVDNDVNWAALAEHHEGSAQTLSDFCFCYLGPGLGAALVSGGTVVHGARGLAGELAHVSTIGPDGRSMALIECFAAWDLLLAGSNAIDVARVTELLSGASTAQQARRDEVAAAVAGAVGSITALFNPAAVVLGGPWGAVAGFPDRVAEQVRRHAAVATDVRASALDSAAMLSGVRGEAVRAAQQALLGRS